MTTPTLVKIPRGKGKASYGVALRVTHRDLKGKIPVNVLKPGVYIFRGFWYSKNYRDHNNYGKLLGEAKNAKVVLKIRDYRQVRRFVD